MMLLTIVSTPLFCFVLALFVLYLRVRLSRLLARRPTIGFLHPYCNDGGGGERVLWVAIRELVARGIAHPDKWRVVVYTGDHIPPAELRENARRRFGVELPQSIEFVQLSCRGWIEPTRYPVATLLGQALGSVLLAAEALLRTPPDVLIDTTGLAYCYPLVRAAGVRHLACYVHYPIVQSDMLSAVASRQTAHNNAAFYTRSAARSALKLAYYRLLLGCYALAGRHAHTVMANGSWTAAHLRSLWRGAVVVVFPPCDTAALQGLPLLPRDERLVLSVAQFRPEKDHALQLQAFALLLKRWRAEGAAPPRPSLVIAGAVRHAADQARLDALRAQAAALGLCEGGLEGSVTFAPNLSLSELRHWLGRAAAGLHTMWNEHFGIGVVEMMAAGVPPIAHDSGGPALDIVTRRAAAAEAGQGTPEAAEGYPEAGLLATSAQQYADAMAALLLGPRAEPRRLAMAAAARASVQQRFSEVAFSDAFCASLASALA